MSTGGIRICGHDPTTGNHASKDLITASHTRLGLRNGLMINWLSHEERKFSQVLAQEFK